MYITEEEEAYEKELEMTRIGNKFGGFSAELDRLIDELKTEERTDNQTL